MIKANELRIGNWISYKGNQFQVDLGFFHSWAIDSLEYKWTKLSPISLTPEVLGRCGFERDSDDEASWMALDILDGDFQLFYSFRKKVVSLEDFNITVSTLHQLQNLYFALTGEELPYKP